MRLETIKASGDAEPTLQTEFFQLHAARIITIGHSAGTWTQEGVVREVRWGRSGLTELDRREGRLILSPTLDGEGRGLQSFSKLDEGPRYTIRKGRERISPATKGGFRSGFVSNGL
jgi:hypothetical protein